MKKKTTIKDCNLNFVSISEIDINQQFVKDSILFLQNTYDNNVEYRNNVILSFAYYEVPVKVDIFNVIMIPREVAENQEYVWNVLRKAKDTTWVKSHLFAKKFGMGEIKQIDDPQLAPE